MPAPSSPGGTGGGWFVLVEACSARGSAQCPGSAAGGLSVSVAEWLSKALPGALDPCSVTANWTAINASNDTSGAAVLIAFATTCYEVSFE